MRKIFMASVGIAVLNLVSVGAQASGHFYASEAGAQSTCPSGEVVWIDITKNMYYHKSSAEFGKSGGAYACVAAARERGYRESKPSQEVAKSN
jgi:hypothetical protein